MKPTLRWILFLSSLLVCFPMGCRPELHAQNAPTAILADIGNAAPERQVTIPADLPGTPQRLASRSNPTDLASLQNDLTSSSYLNKSNLRKYKMARLAANREEKATPPVPELNEKATVVLGQGQFSAVTLNDCLSELSDQEDLEHAGISGPAEQAFKIFPNPGRAYVQVRILRQLNAPFQVLVMSDNGTCMQELRCSQGNAGDDWFVNTEDLIAGVYFLRVKSGTSTMIRKVYIL